MREGAQLVGEMKEAGERNKARLQDGWWRKAKRVGPNQ